MHAADCVRGAKTSAFAHSHDTHTHTHPQMKWNNIQSLVVPFACWRPNSNACIKQSPCRLTEKRHDEHRRRHAVTRNLHARARRVIKCPCAAGAERAFANLHSITFDSRCGLDLHLACMFECVCVFVCADIICVLRLQPGVRGREVGGLLASVSRSVSAV